MNHWSDKVNFRKSHWLFLVLMMAVTGLRAQVFDYVIAQDGTGDYKSFEAAASRLPLNKTERTLIYVKNGTYKEKVSIYKSHSNFSLIGEDRDKVIISWDDYSGDSEGHSTSSSFTFSTEGDGFYAENITFENTAGNVGQAVAVSVLGNEQAFKNCRFTGFQDTYYARKGKQYLADCYFEGATDFIFGEATSIFQRCEIRCVSGGQYITAPADTKLITVTPEGNFYHGLLFLECDVMPGTGVADNSYYLGRPWQPYSSSVYINCTLGDHIRTEGWSTWSNNNHLTAVFAEYNNVDPSGAQVDVSGRASWSRQLTTDEVSSYYNPDYFLDGWDPLPLLEDAGVPQNLKRNMENEAAFELVWDEVADAKGYVILKNDITLGFSETAQFTDTTSQSGDFYKVRSVSMAGALSDASDEVEGERVAVVLSAGGASGYVFRTHRFESVEAVNVQLYKISGQLVFARSSVREVDLGSFRQGVYVIRIEDQSGAVHVRKIAL